MRIHIFLVTCVSLICVCFTSANRVSFDEGNYVVNWTYHPGSDKVSFQVETKTKGWVGFGLSAELPDDMVNWDVVVGGVVNDTRYLNDFYTRGETRPPLDAQQDYNLTNAKQEGDKTTLTFERKRDTGDNKDVELKAGEGVFLVWSYHSSTDGHNTTTFPVHSKRGLGVNKQVIVPAITSSANFICRREMANVVLAAALGILYIYL